ncbi:MAG TPA: MBL fold metallo-hydrolase [Syntrophomonas sp.]|nr:MBL fold metallo-hydrolase [Syntrophomonas sp.]
MIEQILRNLYRIEIPLPNNPLKALNSYLIRGEERSLLVDTGFNLEACWRAMEQALKELNVSMANTDLFITHYHSDHIGLIGHLVTPTNTVFISEKDGRMIEADYRENLFRNRSAKHLYQSGLLAEGVPNLPEENAIVKYASKAFFNFTTRYEGDWINVGGYRFQCVETPGHTAGHICLYEPDRKILIAGDHVLTKITPNIGLWLVDHDALGDYLHSLDKTAALEVELVLPGHRALIYNFRERVEEIKQHHFQRIQNVLDIVGDVPMTAAQVARQMKWDLSFKDWEYFPINAKMHAAGEAMSHLYHLVITGGLAMTEEKGIYYFYQNKF